MKKIIDVLAVVILAGCSVVFGQAPTVWTVQTDTGSAARNATTLVRVGPTSTEPTGSSTTATIYGGGGEYAAFQVAVQAPSGGSGLTITNFTATELSGPGGATIPSSDLILYRESYITIKQHSPTDDEDSCGPGPYSDSNVPYCGDDGALGSTTNIGTPNVPIASATTFPDPLIPFIDPSNVRAVAETLAATGAGIATLAAEIEDEADKDNPNVVKPIVVWDVSGRRGRALYFTRARAPHGDGPLCHHVGIYAYTREALARFVKLLPSPLEKREKLEQLRALEAGMTIAVARIDAVPLSVDTRQDLENARAFLGRASRMKS